MAIEVKTTWEREAQSLVDAIEMAILLDQPIGHMLSWFARLGRILDMTEAECRDANERARKALQLAEEASAAFLSERPSRPSDEKSLGNLSGPSRGFSGLAVENSP